MDMLVIKTATWAVITGSLCLALPVGVANQVAKSVQLSVAGNGKDVCKVTQVLQVDPMRQLLKR